MSYHTDPQGHYGSPNRKGSGSGARRQPWRKGSETQNYREYRPRAESPSDFSKKSEDLVIKTVDFILKPGYISLVYSMPVVRELWVAFTIADSIHNNWNLLKRAIDECRKDDVTGALKTVSEEVIQRALPTPQCSAIWKMVGPLIPKEYQTNAESVLVNVIDGLTQQEIEYVSGYLG
jgi:hypothetical protein